MLNLHLSNFENNFTVIQLFSFFPCCSYIDCFTGNTQDDYSASELNYWKLLENVAFLYQQNFCSQPLNSLDNQVLFVSVRIFLLSLFSRNVLSHSYLLEPYWSVLTCDRSCCSSYSLVSCCKP